jgi:mono/diheme cytochrome c family protein
MSNDLKEHSTTPKSGSAGHGSPVPVWIFCVMLLMLFLGGVYFDEYSGWFNAQLYTPYTDANQLEAYQPVSGAAAILAQGKHTYDSICAACHGPDATGKPGTAPPLAGSEWVNAAGHNRLVEIPQLGLNGQVTVEGQSWNLAMAPMGAQLSDSDLAAVLTYIRSSWGNKGDAISPDDVKSVRGTIAGHPAIAGDAGLKAIKE